MDLLSIIDLAEHRQDRVILINIDFAKAFDKVNWDYIDKALEFFGFGEIFRHMVKAAHKDTSCCTVNAGFSSNYIEIEKGLRQGSPQSTGLFNIAVEMLGISIRQNPKINGIALKDIDKKHGQYADDLC